MPDTALLDLAPSAEDAVRRARLVAAQRLALGALGAAIVLYALSKVLEPRWVVFGYTAAFAEAAVIGALADWFAVVALFRHPLGLKLPHTSILRRNKDRIADNLGAFIQDKFLATDRIVASIAAFDPAARLATWLSQERNAERIGDYGVRALSFGMRALDEQRVQAFLSHYLSTQLADLDLVKPAGRLLDILTENRRYQGLLDALLVKLHAMLSDEEVKQTLVAAIVENIPGKTLLQSLGVRDKAGNYVLEKLLAALADLIEAVKQDPQHPLRIQLDETLTAFAARLRTDPELAQRIRNFQRELAQHPEVRAYFAELWTELRAWLTKDLNSSESKIRARLVAAIRPVGTLLAGDADMRTWINTRILEAVPPLLDEYRPGIGAFIARQVKSWNDDYLVEQLELNIGRDLQYIRLNGTLVGGLAGLALYTITRLLSGA